MILNDGQVDISTEAQRGKGRETGIKGTGERILHHPYPHHKLSGTRALLKKKKEKEKYNLFTSGLLFTYFISWKWFICV